MKRRREVSFHVSSADAALIEAIALRAARLGLDLENTSMDVTATHANGMPLDLKRLLAADDFNFIHDISGIYRHLDRETGQLLDFFVPRFRKPIRERWQREKPAQEGGSK